VDPLGVSSTATPQPLDPEQVKELSSVDFKLRRNVVP